MIERNDISIVFMGTPEFSVPSLVDINEHYNVKAVVTVPDKPQGRGNKVIPSPVKVKALELGIPVFQPTSLKDNEFLAEIESLKPDIFVVIAFRILPYELYSIPKIGSFNVHASLLPKYRGAAPINWAIINGEVKTGLTTFLLASKVDTGNILLQRTIDITSDTTAGDLHDTMMPLASEMALDTIKLLLDNNYTLIEQDNSMATPAPKIFPENCKIDWGIDCNSVRNFIHGVSPVPGAWTMMKEQKLKIFRAEIIESELESDKVPGEFYIEKGKFIIHCKYGKIIPKVLQIQGKKVLNINDFINGYRGETTGILK